jgi:hypothetical protein
MTDFVKLLTDLDEAVKFGNTRELHSVMQEVADEIGIAFTTEYDLFRKDMVRIMQGG